MLALQAELPLVFFMYTVDCFVEASTVFYGSFSSEQSKLCLSNMCDRCHCYGGQTWSKWGKSLTVVAYDENSEM